MGNAAYKRSDAGTMRIEIANPQKEFYPGQTISGTVHLELTKDFPAFALQIMFQGKDSCRVDIHRDKYHDKFENQNAFVELKQTLATFTDNRPPLGIQSYPFTITVPNVLPPTLYSSVSAWGDELYTRIKYKIKAQLSPATVAGVCRGDGKSLLRACSRIRVGTNVVPVVADPQFHSVIQQTKVCKPLMGSNKDAPFKVMMNRNFASIGDVMQLCVDFDNSAVDEPVELRITHKTKW